MGTVNQLLDIARKEIGYTENPPDSNMTKYGKWIGLNGYAWCVSFCQWCCAQANVHLPIKTGSCGALMNAAKQANMWIATTFYMPGDIVIFDFTNNKRTTQHCGIVEEKIPNYGVQTIEGNTSDSGSQDNGGMVCRKKRPYRHIIGAVRPIFDLEKVEEDISKMTTQKFIESLTDEQAYSLLTKAQRHAGTLPEPKWSVDEGHWGKATTSGVINGKSPEGFIKRDEVIAILGRKGLV